MSEKVRMLLFGAGVFLLDRALKTAAVFGLVESRKPNLISVQLIPGFAQFVQVRDSNFAFGLGDNLPAAAHTLLFGALPFLIVVAFVVIFLRRPEALRTGQRWLSALLVSGVLSNSFDRLIYQGQVINYLDLRFLALFGYDRWVATNLADIAVAVGAIGIVLTLVLDVIPR